ncbi:MAG: (Fe-S)-binding protein [Pseudomonadota bacterium]
MRVALFVSCLVDLFRPSAGFAAVKLLERLGAEVVVPPAQTCCGQPAYNSGDFNTARELARPLIDALSFYEHVVVPSGSCAGMLTRHYPELFRNEPVWHAKAENLARRTRELSAFLAEHGVDLSDASLHARVLMHDSCSALRELNVYAAPRELLGRVSGVELVELEEGEGEACCGFGGTFCVKYPDISGRMVSDKAEAIAASGAEVVVSGDIGCLMNIAGRLKRMGSRVRVYHLAEVLAGMSDTPGIGEPEDS